MSIHDADVRTYDTRQVQNATGATDRQMRYWREIGIAIPHVNASNGRMGVPNVYSEADLNRVKKIKRLIDQTGSLQKARRVLAQEDRR